VPNIAYLTPLFAFAKPLALSFFNVLVSFGVLVICRLLREKYSFKMKIATHSINSGT
jgi:hypothetical protein